MFKKKFTVILGIFFTLTKGCVFDTGSDGTQDSGTYTIGSNITIARSYPGGGRLYLVTMTPGDDFTGRVRLSVEADPELTVELTSHSLTNDDRVSEIFIQPGMDVKKELNVVNIISQHADTADTLSLRLKVIFVSSPQSDFAVSTLHEFGQWIQDKHPELDFKKGQEWIKYSTNIMENAFYRDYSEWIFLNETWELTIHWGGWPLFPSFTTRVLLRKRGERNPVFAARRDLNKSFGTIDVEDFLSL